MIHVDLLQMFIQTIFGVAVASGVVVAIVTVAGKKWVEARIQHAFEKSLEAIRHQHSIELVELATTSAKTIEGLRFELRQRELAAVTAELLSLWAADSGNRQRLNQLIWTATFWLPEDVVISMNKLVCYDRDDPRDIRDVVLGVRRYLKGDQDTLEKKDVAVFADPMAEQPH
jgi:hypothetical protein